MSSIRIGGILFLIYPQDHLPRHAHAEYGETKVIIDLLVDGAALSNRRDAVKPPNAKRNHVAKILTTASRNLSKLHQMWEEMHDE